MSTIDANLTMGRMQADAAAADATLTKAKDAGGDRAELGRLANEFESLFLGIVLKSMRNTVQKSGFIDGGNAEDVYRSLLDEEYAKMMATQRHTGIAEQIEDFLLQASGLTAAASDPAKAAGLKAYEDAALRSPEKQATMEHRAGPRLKAL